MEALFCLYIRGIVASMDRLLGAVAKIRAIIAGDTKKNYVVKAEASQPGAPPKLQAPPQATKDKRSSAPEVDECANCFAPEGRNDVVLKPCAKCKMTSYCGRACQKAHWKAGHKQFCVPPGERVPQASLEPSSYAQQPPNVVRRGSSPADKDCPICFDPLSTGALSTLPCSHTFHASCVEDMRKFGVNQVCPMCRVELPPGPTKMCANCLATDGQHGVTLKACKRCKLVHYCGRACQAAHWKAGHKQLCVTPEERMPTPSMKQQEDSSDVTENVCPFASVHPSLTQCPPKPPLIKKKHVLKTSEDDIIVEVDRETAIKTTPSKAERRLKTQQAKDNKRRQVQLANANVIKFQTNVCLKRKLLLGS